MHSWPIVQFHELAAEEPASFAIGPFGSRITKENYVPTGVPVVRGVNLSRGVFVDKDFVYISDEKADELASSILKTGDLVFTHRGTIGQVSMIPRSPRFERYILSSSQVKARLNHEIAVPEFYYYWFRSPVGQQALLANASTVGVPGIASPLSTIRSIKVPLPARPFQEGVAAVLGALDDRIALNERIGQTALELATTTYSQCAARSDWHEIALGEAARWYSGGTPRTSEASYWDGDIPWISALSLKSPWIDDSDRRLTSLGAANGTRLVGPGTIVFVVRGSSLKDEFRVGITQRQVAFGQDCKALVCVDGISPDLLFHAIRSRTEQILELVDETSIGAGRLATELIASLVVRVPPVGRHQVVDELQHLNRLAAGRQKENRALTELRDTLLPGLMSGAIRVRDAEKAVEEAT